MRTCQYCHTENRADAMYCNHCGAALLAGAPSAAASSTTAAAPPPPRPPNATGRLPMQSQLRGRYLILQLVGQGGMAAVYKATNLRTKAVVAIKEMSQDGLSATELREALDSFRFEAVTLQRLRHANLPRVYESFSEHTRHYLVMDYIDGKTLEQYQQDAGNGPLPEADVLRWAKQIASVLSYLHSQHPPIIFRDLKPSNIMLTTDGQIKLIDFGIARVFAPGRSRDTQVLGTPGFAPPEQYGKAQTDARADVYAFGCTLYQLLTGYDPGTTPFNLPPMQSRNPNVSSHVQQAIERATKLDRDQRYPNVEAFARELLYGGSGQTTQQAAPKTSTGTNARRGAGVGAAARVAQQTMAAIVVVQPHTIDFGQLVAGQRGTQSFTISGQNNVPVHGQIKTLSPWLTLDRTQFDGPSTLVQLTADTSKLAKTGKQVSTLQIDCDRQHLYVPVTVDVSPAPAPITKVVPAIGQATKTKGAKAATKGNIPRKYTTRTPRRNGFVRLATSAALALGVTWGFLTFAQQMMTHNQLPFPLTLPVALGMLLLCILLGSVAAIAGSGGRSWAGRWQTTFFGALVGAALLVITNGPYTWAGFPVIFHDPVKLAPSLVLVTPLLVGLGATIGADPNFSRWMLAIANFIGRFPRPFTGLLGAVAAGYACHALAWQGTASYIVGCTTVVGALIGFVLAYNLGGAMRRAARVRP